MNPLSYFEPNLMVLLFNWTKNYKQSLFYKYAGPNLLGDVFDLFGDEY